MEAVEADEVYLHVRLSLGDVQLDDVLGARVAPALRKVVAEIGCVHGVAVWEVALSSDFVLVLS